MADELTPTAQAPSGPTCPHCAAVGRAKPLRDGWLECAPCGQVFHPDLKVQSFRLRPGRFLVQRVEHGGPWHIPLAAPGDWIVTDESGRCTLVSAETFAVRYEPDESATEIEILRRQMEGMKLDWDSYTRLCQEFGELGKFFGEHYQREIEVGEHAGLTTAQVVIRYLMRERDQDARQRMLIELTDRHAQEAARRATGAQDSMDVELL